jgi:hypothetical protein
MKAQNAIKSSFITQLPLELSIAEICTDGEETDQISKKSAQKNPVLGTSSSIPLIVKKTDNKDENIKKKPIVQAEVDDDDQVEEVKADKPLVELKVVNKNWEKVLHEVKNVNSSVIALLKSSKPLMVDGDCLIIEVFYAFHKERLESSKTRKIVEKALKDVLRADLRIKCKVSQNKPKKPGGKETGELTDLNVIVPAAKSDNALDLFDGKLPLR